MRPIDEIRHENLLTLIAIKGGQRQFADAAGIKNPAQVSQWVNRSRNATTGKPRVMSGATARSIEIALGLPDGWMDTGFEGRTFSEDGATATLAATEIDPTDVFMGALELLPQGEREAAASILAQLARTPDSQPMRDALKAIVSSPRKDKHDPVG